MNGKYVVFKREEFNRWYDFIVEIRGTQAYPTEVDDAVVIRRQDAFAPPALDAYANNILMALSLADRNQQEVAKRLREIADYFHQQATLSWDTSRKVPD